MLLNERKKKQFEASSAITTQSYTLVKMRKIIMKMNRFFVREKKRALKQN